MQIGLRLVLLEKQLGMGMQKFSMRLKIIFIKKEDSLNPCGFGL